MVAEVTHEWTVDITFLRTNPSRILDSSILTPKCSTQFVLQAQLNLESESLSLLPNEKHVDYLVEPGPFTWAKKCSFVIISSNFCGLQKTFNLPDQKVSNSMKGVTMPLSDIVGNSLTLRFKGILVSEKARHASIKKPNDCTWPPRWIAQMRNGSLFCDARIKVANEVFNVHKVVLASASRVFQAMLESDVLEKSGILEISDFDSSVIADLLAYIYTGEAPNMEELAEELLLAADKYELISLAHSCMQKLESCLTAENAVEYFVLAEKLAQDNPLKDVCMKFIQDNWNLVSNCKSWKELENTSKDLALQAM